jgi:hypothetical protein
MKAATNLNVMETSFVIDQMHTSSKQCQSELYFITDEIVFLKNMVNSYRFEPNTLGYFEDMQLYKKGIQQISEENNTLLVAVQRHEYSLSGLIECDTMVCDISYTNEHEDLREKMLFHLKRFKAVKESILNHAGMTMKENRNK